MIKINLICVGTLKEKYLREAFEEYKKRLSRYVSFELIEIKESKLLNNQEEKVIFEEGEAILKKIKNNDYVILCDLHGEQISSEKLSDNIKVLLDKGVSPIDIVIGGTFGVSENLRNRSNFKLSLSKMTFTHQMTRILILEQIYRAFKIINNEEYHH